MPSPRYDTPPADARAALRDASHATHISPEIARLRLAILREEHAGALVQIDAVRADDTAIAVKATIGLPGGARHSAISAADVDTGSSWTDQLEHVQAIAIATALDGLGLTLKRALQASAPTTSQRPATPQPAAAEGEDHLPEFSWNAFWQAVNQRGISKDQVEQALGRSVQEATPKEAIAALRAAGLFPA